MGKEITFMEVIRREKPPGLIPIIHSWDGLSAIKPSKMTSYCFTTPWYEPGGLFSFQPDPTECHIIMKHTLQGLHWIHHQGILHRDIKKENILYDKKTNEQLYVILVQLHDCSMTMMIKLKK